MVINIHITIHYKFPCTYSPHIGVDHNSLPVYLKLVWTCQYSWFQWSNQQFPYHINHNLGKKNIFLQEIQKSNTSKLNILQYLTTKKTIPLVAVVISLLLARRDSAVTTYLELIIRMRSHEMKHKNIKIQAYKLPTSKLIPSRFFFFIFPLRVHSIWNFLRQLN